MESNLVHGLHVPAYGSRLTEEQRLHVRELVNALRSGLYNQIQSVLHSPAGYCCLGVAEDVRGAVWGDATKRLGKDCFEVTDGLMSNLHEARPYCELSLQARAYYGFTVPGGFNSTQHIEPEYSGGPTEKERSLWYLNDELGFTFDQIADVIEAWSGTGSLAAELVAA